MIPFLVVLAVAYWLAAPDPVTAGARTASGTAARAAGTGARAHWASGRDGRKLTRTARRDRWSKGGGFWRNLLRLEHGAVVTGKGVKGAVGITRAAVRPVPAAVRAGWVQGRDRHRAKAGNRAVPVALDPPWWRREQPQVQAGEQVQEQPGNSPEVQPAEQVQAGGGQAEGTGDLDTEEQIRARRGDTWNRMFPEPLDESDRRFWTARDGGYSGPLDQDGRPGDPDQWPDVWQDPPATGATVCEAARSWYGADPLTDPPAGTNPDGTTTDPGDAMSLLSDYAWRDGRDARRVPARPAHRPATTTQGDPVFIGIDTDLNDLTTVQDFALKVADMAEESDFAQLVEFCKSASDEVRDFGADMAGDVAEFEEVAAKIGDLLSELVDAATKVKDRGAELVGG